MANVWVVPAGDEWAVRFEGEAELMPARYRTKDEAVAAGRSLARVEKSELFIQGRDGQIQDRDSYGHDPERRPG